jgi:spermidine/putrescine transport system permease protein
MEKQRPKAPLFAFVILITVLVLLYFPLFYMMIGSVIEKAADGAAMLSLRWYREVFADSVMQEALGRSLFIAVGNACISTVLGALASIALLRSNFRFRQSLETLSLISLVMPELVFALSLLSWFFIVRLDLSLVTVMIAHVSFTLSFVIFTVSSRLATLDHSLDEAARDLGASDWVILRKVTLPLLKPALGTAFILCFLMSFDDFLITFFTSGVGSDTLPIKLYASMKLGHTPKLNALSTLMILFSVTLIIFVVRSKSFRDVLLSSDASPQDESH